MYRTLLVWLLLLAVPFQGFAAAGMLPCAAPHGAQHGLAHAAPAPHLPMPAHAAAAANGHAPDCHAAPPSSHDGGQHGHGGQHEGGSCSACCIGAAMAPAPLPRLAGARPEFVAIPFCAGHLPSVEPSLPDRPPRTLSS